MKTLVVYLLATSALLAQAERKLAFEVVSIKPHKSTNDLTMMPLGMGGGRYTATNVHLRQLIVSAYVDSGFGFQEANVDGLPGWAATDGFDIQAQTEGLVTPTKQQTMEMLQAMLQERFKLKIRRGTRGFMPWLLTRAVRS